MTVDTGRIPSIYAAALCDSLAQGRTLIGPRVTYAHARRDEAAIGLGVAPQPARKKRRLLA